MTLTGPLPPKPFCDSAALTAPPGTAQPPPQRAEQASYRSHHLTAPLSVFQKALADWLLPCHGAGPQALLGIGDFVPCVRITIAPRRLLRSN